MHVARFLSGQSFRSLVVFGQILKITFCLVCDGVKKSFSCEPLVHTPPLSRCGNICLLTVPCSAALSSVQSERRQLQWTGRRPARRAPPAVQREVRRAVQGGVPAGESSTASFLLLLVRKPSSDSEAVLFSPSAAPVV